MANVVAASVGLGLLIPNVITILKHHGKSEIQADENDCGPNSAGEDCACLECYVENTENGQCTECHRDCTREQDGDTVRCVKTNPLDAKPIHSGHLEYDPNVQQTEETTEKLKGRDFVRGEFAYDEDAFPSGHYTDFNNYRNAEKYNMKDILKANYESERNMENIAPFLWNGNDGAGGLVGNAHYSRPFVDRLEREQRNTDQVQPQELLKNGIDVSNHSYNLAFNNMGAKLDTVDSQLTAFADGDVMTGFKPISSVYRPTDSVRGPHANVLTNRLDERESVALPRRDRMFEQKRPKDFEVPAQTRRFQHGDQLDNRALYPQVTEEFKNTPLIDRADFNVPQGYKINPEYNHREIGFKEVSGDDVRRSAAIRNKRELPHIAYQNDADVSYLHPLMDISRKHFYESSFDANRQHNHEGKKVGNDSAISGIGERTRDTNPASAVNDRRKLVDPRGEQAHLDLQMHHKIEELRSTSNKVYNSQHGIMPRSNSYFSSDIWIPHQRGVDGNVLSGHRNERQIEPIESRTEELFAPPYAISRDDMIAGPPER